jgi:hypothetical protein
MIDFDELAKRAQRGRQVHVDKSSEDRKRTRKLIKEKIFAYSCTCGQCLKGDYSKICQSHKSIAKECNRLKIPTTKGKVGTWQVTTVTRLFSRKD